MHNIWTTHNHLSEVFFRLQKEWLFSQKWTMDLRFFIGQILVATLTSPYSPHGGVLTLKVENADTSRYIQYLIPTIYDIFTLVFHKDH